MAERIHYVHHHVPATRVDATREYVDEEDMEVVHSQSVAARVIWFIAGVLLVILGFRFLFTLLGANRGNGFVDFIYNVSHPFVAPFFGIFSYHPIYGVSHFELDTLVAMAVYALIAFGLARLVTINRSNPNY